MKRLPRIPVWLVLAPLLLLAGWSLTAPSAARSLAVARSAPSAASAPTPAPTDAGAKAALPCYSAFGPGLWTRIWHREEAEAIVKCPGSTPGRGRGLARGHARRGGPGGLGPPVLFRGVGGVGAFAR